MDFLKDIQQRILVLDGAMGTMLQRGFTGEEVLRMYVEAGADIITTDTFNANRISSGGSPVADVCRKAVAEARKVADEAPRKVYVAGSCGPTGKSLTLDSDASDPTFRQYSFDDFVDAYKEQIAIMAEAGADLILHETCFDALNAKALIYAMEQLGNPLPLIISATVSDRSGRTLTGQTLEAFYRSVSHAPTLAAFGVNCALGAAEMAALVRDIASFSSHPVIFYPNAGLPDEFGAYGDTPEEMASVIGSLAVSGCINIAGGCCGTTPDHIRAIREAVDKVRCNVRRTSDGPASLYVSGLESVRIAPELNFTNIGERTNVAGSRKFARLIAGGDYAEALDIAAAQIEGGADIIDINMDDPMVDSSEKMRSFLRHIAGEPAIARAAVMIDSSHWDTILEGLKNAQGRCIVNSISLKDGEEEFLRKAREIRALGAAMVVMAFDEKGQAVTFDRKVEICRRSWTLLTEKASVPPQDIIFDCNILSIGTGIAEHSRFGIDFIEAVRWIKANLPGARTSGGVSNLSFAFRGNNTVREAMHSAFLYHAIAAGLDMAIVNPQMLRIYDDIPADLRKCVEDVIFDTDPDATSRLIGLASGIASAAQGGPSAASEASGADNGPDLPTAIVRGISTGIDGLTLDAYNELGDAVAVIEGPLMKGMEQVGALFADGRMFLPQVVKSAKVMREAVEVLKPYMNGEGNSSGKPRFVIATVQGDVHDIGKNITSIVLQCSGFEVIDLGVMVPCADVLDKAEEVGAAAIGLSGLITPSLQRMEEVCREMAARGKDLPLFVGGAAASAVHTAVRLAPLYSNVHYASDASATAVMAKKYLTDKESFIADELKNRESLLALRATAMPKPAAATVEGGFTDIRFEDIPFSCLPAGELMPYFDWKMFFTACGVRGEDAVIKAEALDYMDREKPSAVFAASFFDCRRDGDDIVADGVRLPMLRDSVSGACLADFLPADSTSRAGVFAAAVKGSGGDLVGHAVRVTLAEAVSARLASLLRSRHPELDKTGQKLILPGIGYACCPDHSLKRDVLALLPAGLGITLTESCAMVPEASVCGLVIAHRDASYRDIRTVDSAAIDAYAARRGMSQDEKNLFLGHFLEK